MTGTLPRRPVGVRQPPGALEARRNLERRPAVSYSVSTLLTRNLDDVFGEHDPARRRAASDEIFTDDCVFYEPRGVYRGRDEIDRVRWRDQGNAPGLSVSADCPARGIGQWRTGPLGLGSSW